MERIANISSQLAPSSPRLIAFDTDAGADDAVALSFALRLSADFPSIEIKLITTVFGNVTSKQATRNVKTVLGVLAKEVPGLKVPPVAEGADGPLIRSDENKEYGTTYSGYGSDGIGGCSVAGAAYEALKTASSIPTEPGTAAEHLVRLARQHKGQLSLIALGPLTNIALACRLDPAFLSNLSQLYIMGGSVLAIGNMSPTSEFNFYMDPESARIVFDVAAKHSTPGSPKLVFIPKETCESHAFNWEFYDRIRNLDSGVARFFAAFTKDVERYCRLPPSAGANDRIQTPASQNPILSALSNTRAANNLFNPWDLFATVPALFPDSLHRFLDAEVSVRAEESVKGLCAVRWNSARLDTDSTTSEENEPKKRHRNARVVLELDRAKMAELVLLAFR